MGLNLANILAWPWLWAEPTHLNPRDLVSGDQPHFLLHSSTEIRDETE